MPRSRRLRRCSLALILTSAGACRGDLADDARAHEEGAAVEALCATSFPALPAGSVAHGPALDPAVSTAWSAGARAARAAIPGLTGYWPLDGTFADASSTHPLTPHGTGGFAPAPFVEIGENQAYAPSGTAQTGAVAATFTTPPLKTSLTLSGWVFVPEQAEGVLFGFGDAAPASPKLHVAASGGSIVVNLGSTASGGASLRLGAGGDRCWHHVAVVVPANYVTTGVVTMYVDGVATKAAAGSLGTSAVPTAQLSGGAFRVGEFTGNAASAMAVDEVRLFSRPLSATEIVALASAVGGTRRCAPVPQATWTPGTRCAAATFTPAMDLAVRVISADTVAVVQDPTDWLRARFADGCGPFLGALAVNAATNPKLSLGAEYGYAASDVVIAQRKPLLTAIQTAAHLSFATCGGTPAPPVSQSVWPEGVSELRVPVLGSSSEFWTTEARVAYVTYAKLPFAMTPGGTYAVRDSWGNLATFSYDGATPSWSIATNQVGYVADAPAKYAYVGAWLGTSGELDVAPFAGKPFTVVDDASGAAVLTGTASVARGDDTYSGQPVRGASALQLDLSSLSTPGTYRVAVPGVGTSRRFVVGPDAIGEPFYVHARGLYHARCGTLDPTLTPWARGDAHQTTLVAAFPPEDDDYKDHSAQGWGFRDAAGKYAAHTTFDAVARTATTTPLTGVAGGWHDAGDFDRNSHHLGAVEDLAYAYLHFPQNFSDGQLHLPESGNGVPDLLDEATWGIDVFRRSQAADGRVSTRIESTSHPKAWDPGKDPAPYYASLPTRTGSLRYAAAAATLSRALATAGAKTASATWLDSAKRAYSFGTSAARAEITLSVGTAVHTWKEAPAPDATQRLHAAMALSIATKDPHYLADLALPEVAAAFTAELATYQDQGTPMRMADVALAPAAALPAGWTTQARAKVLAAAATWKGWQDAEPYRKLWYPPTHALFWTMGWGNDGYVPIRHLIAGYRVSGDATYRRAALLAVDWMLGANPQGKSLTTGLGAVPPQTVLHLPSMIDGLAEPAPGITPFGYVEGTVSQFAASRIYGIFDAANAGYGFAAAAIPLLPAAMSSGATTTTTITAKLAATWPIWHRQTLLDQQNPPTTEFTVYETIAPAAAVTGCLLSPGWKPSASLLARAPRTPEAARDALWALPLHTQYRFQTPMRAPGDREARIATSMPRVRRR